MRGLTLRAVSCRPLLIKYEWCSVCSHLHESKRLCSVSAFNNTGLSYARSQWYNFFSLSHSCFDECRPLSSSLSLAKPHTGFTSLVKNWERGGGEGGGRKRTKCDSSFQVKMVNQEEGHQEKKWRSSLGEKGWKRSSLYFRKAAGRVFTLAREPVSCLAQRSSRKRV